MVGNREVAPGGTEPVLKVAHRRAIGVLRAEEDGGWLVPVFAAFRMRWILDPIPTTTYYGSGEWCSKEIGRDYSRFSLRRAKLPPEIWMQICASATHATLSTLCRVNSSFLETARPFLYRDPGLEVTNSPTSFATS